MTLVDQLSRQGIPYGIRRDGSVFVMAGDEVMNVKGMTLSRVCVARNAKTTMRDRLWIIEGQRNSYEQQQRKRVGARA